MGLSKSTASVCNHLPSSTLAHGEMLDIEVGLLHKQGEVVNRDGSSIGGKNIQWETVKR